MNNKEKALSVAMEYFNAWSNQEFEKAASFLSDEIMFEMPINAYTSKEEFLRAVKFTAQATLKVNLLTRLGNEEEAILVYNLVLTGLAPLKICECFKVINNKIMFIRHIHDTYELRNAGFDKNKA